MPAPLPAAGAPEGSICSGSAVVMDFKGALGTGNKLGLG